MAASLGTMSQQQHQPPYGQPTYGPPPYGPPPNVKTGTSAGKVVLIIVGIFGGLFLLALLAIAAIVIMQLT